MTQNLKIEVVTETLSESGHIVTNLVTKEELSQVATKKADLGSDGKIPTSQLPENILNTSTIVGEVKTELESTIQDAVQEANAYAESYVDDIVSKKADLGTDGKISTTQLPKLDQYSEFKETTDSIKTELTKALKTRTDELEFSKASLDDNGKVLREQLPEFDQFPGVPELLDDLSTRTVQNIEHVIDQAVVEATVKSNAVAYEAATRAEAAAVSANIGNKVYSTPAEGVKAGTGVPVSSYFNVRSPRSEYYVDEYLNRNGVPEATGKSYPSAKGLQDAQASAGRSAAIAEAAATAATIGAGVFATPEAGVAAGTGVADGAYFNVRSSSNESYIDEYQNVGGGAVSTGKSYLSALGVQQQEKPANTIKDASGKDQQEINDQLAQIVEFYSIEKFTRPSDGGDASLMFKRAFDYAATKPYLIYFYAPKGQTYLLKTATSTDPAVPNSKVVLDLPGNVCFDGNGCTIKIANAFGNYRFLFRQATYSDGGYFKNFTFDENHTNNPKTTNEATLDRRSVFSMWAPGSSLGSLEFERVIFKDVVGVHQITTSSYKKLSIKWCEVHSSSLEAPFVDRTAFYCGGDAEVLHNKFYSEGKNAVTCIELHNSNSTAMFNVSNGFRYGCFIVPEPTLPRYNPIYQNVVVMFNNFENCLAGIKLWTYAAALPMKDITVEHNTVTLNGYLNTDSVVQAVDYGIGTLPNWASSIDNLSMQHNTVRFITHLDDIPSSVQHAYSFFSLISGAKYTLTNSSIRFNKAINPPLSGFNWEFLSTNHTDSVLQKIDFSNNETFNAGTSGDGHGARFLNVRRWRGFVSSNNTATDDRTTPHTISVTSVFGGFADDEITTGFNLIKDKLKLTKISTAYIHYRADKAFKINGYVNAREDTRDSLRATTRSQMLDEATGYVFKKLDGASLEWATFADVPTKPVKGWAHYGSTFNQIQPSAFSPSIFQIIQSGYLYKAEWAATTAYALNDQINAGGRVYKCTVAGTSGSTMPTSATTEVDGTVTWSYMGAASITKSIGGRAIGLTESSTTAQIVAALKSANLA